MEDLSYIDPSSPTLRQSLANVLRGMTKKEDYQQMGQAIQNTAQVMPSVLESLARGGIAQVPGTVGDVSQTLRDYFPQTIQSALGNRQAPTTEEILQAVPRINPDYQGSSQHEMVGSMIAPALGKMLKMGAEATKGMKGGLSIAYHGTPHEVKGGFDLSKVGTGEKAQAYGHGIYFAESPEVANNYRINLSYDPDKLKIGNKQLGDYYDQVEKEATKLPVKLAQPHYEKMEVLERLMDNQFPHELTDLVGGMSKSTQDWFKKTVQPNFQTYGNLYKVDIPDADIPKMLNYDSPIKDQPELYNLIRNNIKDPDIRGVFERNAEKGISGANAYSNYIGGKTDAERSANALKMGIKGIRYLDEGSRGKEAGTYNFVSFEPQSVKILEKNGKPVPSRKEILKKQFDEN
jgi:hypothetical protein